MVVLLPRRALRLAVAVVLSASVVPSVPASSAAADAPDHLVVSEIVTGGATASDEMIELYNPTAGPLPLEGLELVYASASGLTVTRRAAWELGAPEVPAGGHVLVAHQDGIFAAIADATYAAGMAATGGSVAIRVQGASSPIDALGWGTATGAWLEGVAAPAPVAGASLERLPGGSAGSTQDTDDNATDFVERPVPEPQNLGSPPTPGPGTPAPTPTPTPTPIVTPEPTPTPAVTATPTPVASVAPAVTTIAAARALPDGTTVTIEGVALTDAAFHDGGGFVADASAGIAVLVDGGTFERGVTLRLTGEVGDRFSQRTLRVAAADVTVLGAGSDPALITVTTGAIGEGNEGSLARVAGTIAGSGSTLTTGLAFDLDDGSGVVRLVVGTTTGIDASGWGAGTQVDIVGVIGQRDSTGSGTSGYRLMPRDPNDLASAAPPATSAPTATAVPSGSTSPSASASPTSSSVSIADARAAAKNAKLTVSGVVTLGSGIVNDQTAVLADATGAIVLRLGSDAGSLMTGEQVEVDGTRSTLSGMETLRVTKPPRRLGTGALPEAVSLRTGDAGESHEAQLIEVRGAVVANARRASSGSVSFDLDDGSGPLRIVLAAPLAADATGLPAGTWVEAIGVLGQETTGAKPARGYRVWPATLSGVRIVAAPASGPGAGGSGDAGGSGPEDGPPAGSLDEIGDGIDGLRFGATLVAAHWPELGIAGLLWDGVRLAAIEPGSADIVAALVGSGRVPMALDLGSLRATGTDAATGIGLVALGREPGDVLQRDAGAQPPVSVQAAAVAWVSVVGPVTGPSQAPMIKVGSRQFRLDRRCESETSVPRGIVSVTGIGLADQARILVPCGGLRPAPALARTTRATVELAAPDPAPVLATVDVAPRRLLAGLLAAAALMLGGIAAALRWRRPPDPADEAAAIEPEAGATLDDTTAEPPRLTLVSVTREHGS